MCSQGPGEETLHRGEEQKTWREELGEEEPAAGLQEVPGIY